MKNWYRNRTPLVQLFSQLNDELERAEKLVHRFSWFRENCYAVQQKLALVDASLPDAMMLVLEGHPGSPFGLAGLDVEGMALCRSVDRFQAILVEFIGEVFRIRPETLRALEPEPVDVSEVLRSATIDEFRELYVARRL